MKFKFYKTKEFVVYADNHPTALHSLAESLGEGGVNIDSISAGPKDENTVLFRVLTSDPETAEKVLSRNPHVRKVLGEDIIVVELENRPGELAKLTHRLMSKGVNIEAIYIVRADSTTEVALKPSDLSKAEEALSES